MISLGPLVAWLALLFTAGATLFAGARVVGALKQKVESHEKRIASSEHSMRQVADILHPLGHKVAAHDDRVRELEIQSHAHRAAVAETTKEVAVLVEQNRWIRASLERIEKRMDNAPRPEGA